MKKQLTTTSLFAFFVSIGLAQQIKLNPVAQPSISFARFLGGMAQDKSGFVWIASRNGLFRFDGYNYVRYAPKTGADFRLETVYIDRQGILWIATWMEGLYQFDPVKGTWTHYAYDPMDSQGLPGDKVRAILEDSEGILWFGTQNGLAKYDRKTGHFHTFKHDPNDKNSISDNYVRKIYEDKQGTLWIGTGSIWFAEGGGTDQGGLNRLDKKAGKFIRYLHDPNNPKSLINNKIQAIYEDSRGVFWVGSAGDGLHTMNRATGEFDRHQYDPYHPEKLSRPKVKDVGYRVIDHITFIDEDSTKQIWIGTFGNGLARYDPASQITKHYGVVNGLQEGVISAWSFLASRDGILWIGDFDGFLYRVDPSRFEIPHSSLGAHVSTFEEDLSQELWIGTDKGIFVKNQKTGASRQFVHDVRNPNSLSSSWVTKILCDPSGTIWVGTNTGLNRFDPKTNSFTRYHHDPEDSATLIDDYITAMADAGGDSLWVGTTNGLDLMMKSSGKFTHFNSFFDGSDSVVGISIATLMQEKSGNLWVGTWGFSGLIYVERETNKVTRFLRSNFIKNVMTDSEGTIWVGTDAGLYKRKNASDDFEKALDINIPGASSVQAGLIEDDRKNIWAKTEAGILQINLQTGQVKNYADEFGLSRSQKQTQLSWGASFKSVSGKIYFGDNLGYSIIAPSSISNNIIPPDIVFTDLKIDGQSILKDTSNILSGTLENLKSLSLRYNQNTLTIHFVGIHFASPENNRLIFMLENYDQEWRVAGADKSAHYSNVSPGQYTFKVKAASSDGVWAERSISITITPPWWKTWWAYASYGLIFIVGVFLIDRFQRRRLLAKANAIAKEKELEQAREIERAYKELKSTQAQLIQAEKMASLGELTAGIAHEIQNPLNFVNNFSEINAELAAEINDAIDRGKMDEIRTLAADIKSNQEKIREHGQRADAIVKGMLQHSRSSTGEKEPTDINKLVEEYLRLAFHGMRAKDKSFNASIQTEFDPQLPLVPVVAQDIGRVLLNLINNAFQAVGERKATEGDSYTPEVRVETSLSGSPSAQSVTISVSDNGPGIPDAIKEKIFQPFFTTKPTGQGTGLGLSLSYDIIKAHQGTISVDSQSGERTTFTIHLPASIQS